MTKIQTKLFTVGAMCAAMAMSSCVDNAYDLNNVDMMLGTTGELTLPRSSTGDILLKNLLDLSEEGIIKEVGENYYVSKSDVVNIDPMKVNDITMSPGLTPLTFPLFGQPGENGAMLYPIPVDGEYKAFLGLTNGISNNVTEDITNITYIGVQDADKGTLVLTIELASDVLKYNAYRYHIDDFELDIPKGWTLKGATCNGRELLPKDENKDALHETGRLIICEGKDETGYDGNDKVSLQLSLDGMHVDQKYDAYFDNAHHKLLFKDGAGIQLKGTYRVEQSEMKNTMPYITTMVSTDFPQLHLTHLAGEGHVKIDATKADLGNLPDFLTDEQTCLDLTNPVLFIKFHSPIAGEAILPSAKFVGMSGNQALATVQTAEPVHIISPEGQQTKVLVLADHKEKEGAADFGFDIPEEYKAYNLIFVRVPNLKSLLKKIPDQINMEFVEGIQLKCNDLNVPANYLMEVDYNLFTPIKLGSDFKLVYTYNETDWNLGQDYKKLNAGLLEVNAQIDNKLGTKLHFSLDLLDKAAKKIPFVNVEPIVVPNNAQNYPIQIVIKPEAGYTISDVLGILDGIRYKAVVSEPKDGELELKNNTPILLHDIQVSVKGGVTYDAN